MKLTEEAKSKIINDLLALIYRTQKQNHIEVYEQPLLNYLDSLEIVIDPEKPDIEIKS